MSSAPDVSVVIPTFKRPDLVLRAVHSALAQTVTAIEVIVVIDGPDPATVAALTAIPDSRLRLVSLPGKGGAPNARNVGIRAARAPWTRRSPVAMPVVASRLINRTPRAELVMPRRLPADGEPLCEYFTVRRGLFHGEGFIQTSTIMAPTELLRRIPFTVGLRRMQELDWALRATAGDDSTLLIAPEPLVVWHTDEDRPRISGESPYPQQLQWLEQIRPLLTRRAYAALAMSVICSMAATTRSPRIFFSLLAQARRHGDPGAVDYLTYLQIWMVPPQLRRSMRDLLLGRGRARRRTAAVVADEVRL
jgi:hypothetical protein